MNGLIGKKQDQTQGFLQDGARVPLTVISAMENWVTQIKTQDKEGYSSIKLGFDIKKKPSKRELGQGKKAGLQQTPRFFREIKGDIEGVQLGSRVSPSDVFKPGDLVDVMGMSKGKGFAGVVKRHHFKGGPRTHGQSDRERAPGSIGQTTTPGHVYRGKRMAGHMGHENVTVKNLEVIEITNDGAILIKGLVPGAKNSIVVVKKVGENKKFIPLYKEPSSAEASEGQGKVQPEVKVAEEAEKIAEGVQVPAEDVQEETESVEEKIEAASAESSGEPKEVKENAS